MENAAIIGGADGPTAIFVMSKISWEAVGVGAGLVALLGIIVFVVLRKKKKKK